MRAPDIWTLLGIDVTDDVRAIRRAYAAQLKAIDIDADPERYAALRLARDEALRRAKGEAPQPGEETDAAEPVREGERLEVDPFRAPLLDTVSGAGAITTHPVEALTAFEPMMERVPLADARARDAETRELWTAVGRPLDPPLIARAASGTITAFARDDEGDGAHFNAILAILFPNGERRQDMPAPEEEAALLAHLDAVKHGSRIGEMAYFADSERWFADIIAHGAPASNCLMAPAADFFRWRERAGELGETDTVAFINRRLKVFGFVEQVSRDTHPWNRAWRELTTFAHERSRRSWGVKRQHVRELLETVRRDYPDAEGYFDGTRVALWENGSDWSGLNWGYAFIGPVLLLGVLGRCSEMVNERNQPIETPPWISAPAPPLAPVQVPATADQRADIDRALRAIGYRKLALATIEQRNPELASTLKSNWLLAAGDGRKMAEFPLRLREALNARARMAIGSAPYEIVAGLRRIELERAELHRAYDAVLCDDLFRLGKVRSFPGSEALDRRQAVLVEDMLLETTGLMPQRQADVTIPGDVVARIVDRTDIPAERVHAALAGDADASDRCNVRIALLQTLLELPPGAGLALLRSI